MTHLWIFFKTHILSVYAEFELQMIAVIIEKMQDHISEFLNKKTIAVVGATNRPGRFGYIIFRNLLDRGYNVLPVHPILKTIDGHKVYSSLTDIPEKIDAVDFVVTPAVTEKVVEECARLGIRLVWMQPGAESRAAIDFCEQNGIACIHGTCVLIHHA